MIKSIIFDLNGVLLKIDESSSFGFVEENVNLVKKLSEKYQLGIISNAGASYKELLRENDLLRFFKVITLSDLVGFNKPDKEIFEITLEELDNKPEEAVFIDDNFENVEAAKLMGIKSILYENVNQLKEELFDLNIEL